MASHTCPSGQACVHACGTQGARSAAAPCQPSRALQQMHASGVAGRMPCLTLRAAARSMLQGPALCPHRADCLGITGALGIIAQVAGQRGAAHAGWSIREVALLALAGAATPAIARTLQMHNEIACV